MSKELNFTRYFRHYMVKITQKEPTELDDNTYVKYLIIFKKWLVTQKTEDKEQVRRAFASRAKPRKTFW